MGELGGAYRESEHMVSCAAFLVMVIIIPLLCLVGVNWIGAEEGLRVATKYNSGISSMIQIVVASYLSNSTSTSLASTSLERTPTSTLTTFSTSTLRRLVSPPFSSEEHLGTSIMEVLSRIRLKPSSPGQGETELMSSAINVMRTAVVSVADSCWSSCLHHTNTRSCFTSCTATNTAMPTLRAVSYQDADIPMHVPTWLNWAILSAAAVLFSLMILTCCIFSAGQWINEESPIAEDRSSLVKIDLIDGLCRRKAKLDHDKAFALQSILQKLAPMDIKPPDYSYPLNKTYEQLNLHLVNVMGPRKLLFPASLARLSGLPSWMPDWSKEIDKFWWSYYSRASGNAGRHKFHDELQLEDDNTLILPVQEFGAIDICFEFKETRDNFHEAQREIHLANLGTAIELFTSLNHLQGYVERVPWSLKALFISGATSIPEANVKKWLYFLSKNSKKSVHFVFHTMQEKPELLRTHMSVCNEFARARRQVFLCCPELKNPLERQEEKLTIWGKIKRMMSGEGYQERACNFYFGIGTNAVQEGDCVVRVEGVATPLVIRYHEAGNSKASLLSPAIVNGSGEDQVVDRKITLI
jgi:hypothetical protein